MEDETSKFSSFRCQKYTQIYLHDENNEIAKG